MDPPQNIADGIEEDVDMITLPEPREQTHVSPEGEEPQAGGVGDTPGAETGAETATETGSTDSQQTLAAEQDIPIRTGKPTTTHVTTLADLELTNTEAIEPMPPVSEQIKTIETILKQFAETPVEEGDTVFLVSRQWLGRAQAFGARGAATKETANGSSGPGPVDNSDIIHSILNDANDTKFVRLKPGTGLENFEVFPEEAWRLLISWYGLAPGQQPIVRTAHNTTQDSMNPNVQFEFHPPVFTIHRLWSANSPIFIGQQLRDKNPAPPLIVRSSAYRLHDFLKQVKHHADVDINRKIRLWRVLQTLPTTESSGHSSKPTGISTPPDSPGRESDASGGSWPHLLLEVDKFLKLERGVERDVVDVRDTTHHPNYNGNRSLATADLTVDQTLVVDEYIDTNSTVSNCPPKAAAKDKLLAPRGSSSSLGAQPARGAASGRSSPASSAPVTRGRAQQKSGRTIGCVGLQNLGNTCYMNSALQCVRSVEELTKYFLTREAEKEINPDNPLSHNGDVARAYGRLLEDLYKDPPLSSVAPRQFKGVIGRYAPSFSGYGQQDSQEFLGFLLDGLQEDLNRIKKKPYIEKPDSTDDMINDPEAIREMADKVWDITKKRDDSVIADLFTGMYKSTLVCPVCAKVSITFDPFTNLTLPLPIASVWSRPVKYYPLNDSPVLITVEIDKNSSFKMLKEFISARVGVPVERLCAAEEFRNKFFKLYEDLSSVSEEIQANDIPTVHELESVPTNTGVVPKPKKQKYRSLLDPDFDSEDAAAWDDPRAARLLVPVVHRFNSDESGFGKRYGRKSNPSAAPPHFIVLTPQEARSEDTIRRKILEKVATFTTWPEFARMDESESADSTDAEIVNTSSDVDSAGDSNVVAKSVEGEEGLVDVTMKDVDNNQNLAAHPGSKEYPRLLKKFNSTRPKWIDPRQFLHPNLQNMFDVSYFSEGNVSIPNGWSVVQDDNRLPRLITRQPKEDVPDMEPESPATWPASEESGSEGTAAIEPSATTRMVDESSEDSDFPKPKNIHPRSNNNRGNKVSNRGNRKKKATKTYSKKNKRRLAKQPQTSYRDISPELPDHEESPEANPSGPLIRLGEGLVVDWNEQAWECVFGGDPQDDAKGMPTFLDVPKLEDSALEEKQKQRQTRRKRGITLDDCLAEFEKEEILSEQDTWYCPRCKEHRRASKKFDLWKTPDILAVHLKRFSSAGWRREKLDILVDFPVEGLDLSERVINREDGKQEVYDLIGVDDHWGGLGGGHYTAFAKNFIDGQWYEYNDASVSRETDLSRIVTSSAYLLFYRRRSDVPLGGPRFQGILDRYNNPPDDEDMSDSGEGQRLGQGSSLRGSPSALTGAGLTLQGGDHGSASGYGDSLGRSIRADVGMDSLPASTESYSGGLDQLAEADDDASVGTPGAVDGMGIIQWENSPGNHGTEDPREDEGIDMKEFDAPTGRQSSIEAVTNVMSANWNFCGLASRARSEAEIDFDDLASDRAQNDFSDDDRSSFAADANHEDAETMQEDRPEPGADYILPDQPRPQSPQYELPPAPEFDDQAHLGQIAEGAWDSKVYKVPADVGDDAASSTVEEIHLGDEESDKARARKP